METNIQWGLRILSIGIAIILFVVSVLIIFWRLGN